MGTLLKDGKNGAANAGSPLIAASETPSGTKTPRTKQKVNIDFSKTGTGSGSKTVLDLNKIIPDMKGSAAYTAIASRLSAVRVPSLATAAASLAMPLTVAATTLPQSGERPSRHRRNWHTTVSAAEVSR